jgi:NAD(P)H-hydrate repair Nnr-like enzyme with NAD(P)H-hydrate dehydratase domain
VVAASNGTAAINCAAYGRAVPWLATAGAGDVLAGLITGLAARMPDLARAVEDAAWLHVETAREAGPGMIAEDLPEAVPPSCGGARPGG